MFHVNQLLLPNPLGDASVMMAARSFGARPGGFLTAYFPLPGDATKYQDGSGKWSTPATTIANNSVALGMLQQISALRVLGKKAPSAGDVEELSASELLDFLSTTQGRILYRDASNWQSLAVGNNGEVLTTQGASANPAWVNKAATQNEMEAGSSILVFTTPGRQQFHPSAAKTWTSFNGSGTLAERSAYNVSGYTDNGAGLWNVQNATDFSSGDYSVQCTAQTIVGTLVSIINVDSADAPATTDFGIACYSWNGASLPLYDSPYVFAAAFGDQ